MNIKNNKVCVIGGAGFLGSHLVDYLVDERDCYVLVLDNLKSGSRKHLNKKAKFKWFDIRDNTEQLERILKEHEIEYVFNYAADPYIPDSFTNPEPVVDSTAVAVLHVLEACTRAGVKRILQVSSAEIYGDAKKKIKEDELVLPHSTYGASKVFADNMVQIRWREAKTPAIAMRQFNCVGERETHEYVIPEIISQLAEGNVVRLGNNSTRDFQYAGDAVRMAVALLEEGELGEVYNMGSEDAITIYALAELIGHLMGHESIEIVTDEKRKRPWEIWHLQSDNTKLYSVIGEYTHTPLEEALRKTIQYYYDNGKKWDF